MRKIIIFPNIKACTQAAAAEFIQAASGAIDQKGIFFTALSGGNTPQPLYQFLAEDPGADCLDWAKIHFFWGDERTVPPGHPDSNYSRVLDTLLQPRKVPTEHIHRIRGEDHPQQAAQAYQEEILAWLPGIPPVFDFILLGMGADGHTASLFPETKVVTNPAENQWVAANYVPILESWRITFTPQLINAASKIIFLITGLSKAVALSAVVEGPKQPDKYPSQLINPSPDKTTWMIDQDAGSRLQPELK